ncbi:hypothetical protein [Macrococcus carouselicus]|uniref:Uncharacterized protein n=1 Tax=Macrococcus carouselicus TaxID=69969 RepID=A0A9Q8CJS2_9STAP|nr:hypothetical protein [Macrococcus carouselicus]TDM00805.1 hypothetical protein ERX40_08315 [Macrococcus carouselicus]
MSDWLHISEFTLFLLISPFIVIVMLLMAIALQLNQLLRQQKLMIQQQQELIRLTIKHQVNRRNV